MEIDIGIKKKDRQAIAEGLGRLLSDTFVLYLTTHGFHWNVTGPMFQTLHAMFMTQYTELWNALDEIAERIRALGYPAPASMSEYLRQTRLQEVEGVPKAEEMIRTLVKGHEAVCKTARELVPVVEAANDEPTLDLLTQRLQIHEKTAWMLRSLLE